MDKSKGVRKYGRVRQALRWARYIVHITCCLVLLALVILIAFGSMPYLMLLLIVADKGRSDFDLGRLLHSFKPQENPLLPDKELLVRASSSSAAQPAELLRAAPETMDEKPQELLRMME